MSYSIPSISFKETRQNSRKLYQQMWRRYSQNVQPYTPVTLDYLVARRTFEEGYIPKEIAFMLTVGSPYIAQNIVQIDQKQGKDKVRADVSQTVRAACQQKQEQKFTKGKQKERQLEL